MNRFWMRHLLVIAAGVTLTACPGNTPDPGEDTGGGGGADAASDASDASGGGDAAADTGEVGTGADAADAADADDPNPCGFEAGPPEEIPAPQIHTPKWAFEPWISKDISDRDDTYAFVDGFIDRDIPIGVVVLDSPWETNYNTFEPDPVRYPEFEKMVDDMGEREVKVVLWITSLTNRSSLDSENGAAMAYDGPASNFFEGLRCNFYINDNTLYTWWKGRGGSIDFNNEAAAQWWHRQQDALIDMGVAGWKLDFGEEYVAKGPIKTATGTITHQEYSELYYEDFYAYGAHRAGGTDKFVTMVRAWDESYQWPGRFFAKPEHAPVVWAGDNRRDWLGLIDALDHMFRSAAAGYVVVGSDLGGYLDRDDQDLTQMVPFDQDNFARWTALAAMTPFMQLHGRANLSPWTLPGIDDQQIVDRTVAIYRYWAKLHSAMVPFWYSLAEEAYAGRAEPIMRPIGQLEDWDGDYRFMVGDAFLVAPLLDGTGARDVLLPEGARWYDWWTDDVHQGGETLSLDYADDQLKIPVLVREGAIVPMDVVDDANGLGNASSADVLTVLMWPSTTRSVFALHDEGASPVEYAIEDQGNKVVVDLPAASKPTVVRVRFQGFVGQNAVTISGGDSTERADLDALLAADSGHVFDGVHTWVKVGAARSPTAIEITRGR